MKKNYLFISLFCLLFSSCAYLLNLNQTYDDEFKNTKTHTLTQIIRPEEFRTGITGASITYSRVITDSLENVKVYFIISRSTNSFQIDNRGYVKLEGKKFELNCKTEAPEFKSKQESTTTSTIIKDSLAVKTTTNTDVKDVNWYDDKFVVEFTPEMVDSLLRTDEVLFRFYFGPEQASFRIKGFGLSQIKKLFDN